MDLFDEGGHVGVEMFRESVSETFEIEGDNVGTVSLDTTAPEEVGVDLAGVLHFEERHSSVTDGRTDRNGGVSLAIKGALRRS